jgi:hypothetical protein
LFGLLAYLPACSLARFYALASTLGIPFSYLPTCLLTYPTYYRPTEHLVTCFFFNRRYSSRVVNSPSPYFDSSY